jgi:hypothetical protein
VEFEKDRIYPIHEFKKLDIEHETPPDSNISPGNSHVIYCIDSVLEASIRAKEEDT